jgi:hypothetical protein
MILHARGRALDRFPVNRRCDAPEWHAHPWATHRVLSSMRLNTQMHRSAPCAFVTSEEPAHSYKNSVQRTSDESLLASEAQIQRDRRMCTDQAKNSAISRSQIVERGIGPERDTRHQGTGLGSGGLHLIHVPHRSRAASHQTCRKTRARGSKWPSEETPVRANQARARVSLAG